MLLVNRRAFKSEKQQAGCQSDSAGEGVLQGFLGHSTQGKQGEEQVMDYRTMQEEERIFI